MKKFYLEIDSICERWDRFKCVPTHVDIRNITPSIKGK